MTPLCAGWGFRAAAQARSFADCWAQACAQLAPTPYRWTFAVLDSRLQTPAWAAFAAWAAAAVPGAPCRAWPESAIAQLATPTLSPRLLARFAAGSVCEALALHAARHPVDGLRPVPQTRLVLRRIVSADRLATLAVARIALPLSSLQTGVAS